MSACAWLVATTLLRAPRSWPTRRFDEILLLSDAWLTEFRDSADRHGLEGRELRNELRQFIAAEYVAVTWDLPDLDGYFDHESINVHALPGDVIYNDIYEITASGVSIGARLNICKSVAEPFGESERAETMVGIKKDFFANAASDGEPKGKWQITFHDSEDPRVIGADIVPGDNWND